MKKVYLVFNKKRVFTPENDITFTGIVKICGVYDTKEKAEEGLKEAYQKEKSDFYAYKECFCKGKVIWSDHFLTCEQQEEDKTIKFNWEIKEVEVK